MQKNFTLKCLLMVLIFQILNDLAIGQTIFTNPITDPNPSAFNPFTNGQFYEPDITVSGISRSSGLTASSAGNRYSASNWSIAANIDLSKYFEFAITPVPGFSINFLSFVYAGQVSTGAPSFAFRSSMDGFTANIGSPTAGGSTINLTAAAFQGVNSPITFRFYVYNIAATSTTYSINDFTFNRQPQYFQSAVASGDWNTATTWVSSSDNSSFTFQGLIPSGSDKIITVKNGNTVSITTPVLTDETIVNGKLQVSGSGVLSLNNGSGDDLTINSTGIVDAGVSAFGINSALVTINITGRLMTAFLNGFTGAGGLIATGTVTLNNASTIEYDAPLGNQIITARTDYSNITFSGGGTKTPSNAFTPAGTLYVTGSAIVDARLHNVGDGVTLTNFTMDGGRLILGTTGTQPMMAGTYNLTGGVVEFNGAGSQTIRTKTYQNIEVTGAGVGNSSGNITLNSNGTFNVKNGGVFVINDNNITGTGGTQTVTIENGGIFRSENNEGFNGFAATLTNNSSISSTITNINLNTGSTVEYMRNGNQPITASGSLIYSNLSLSGTGIKTAPSGILTVQGNLTKSGTSTFAHNAGTVLLNGANQTFAGLPYNNLILSNNTKTTSGNSTIIDSIKINDGTTLSISGTPDTITLHSDATKTARIGQLGTGVIAYNTSGKFVVERYIPARKAWRFLSVPTSSSQTIQQAWQEGATVVTANPKPTYGTIITSNIAGWSANGFDEYSLVGPSVKTYNKTNNGYNGIASTNATSFSPSAGGYFIFIRGDRTATAYNSPVTSTTLRTTGQLFTGTQSGITIDNQFTPVNNSFASQIDLAKLSVIPAYYIWDPNRGGTNGFGGFTTFLWNTITGTFDVTPQNTGSYGTTNNLIDNGQAFLASTLGSPTTIQFTEDIKTGSVLGISPFTPAKAPGQQLRSDLYAVDTDGSWYIADGILNTYSDNYYNDIDAMDAKKNINSFENLSIERDKTLLAIERRQALRKQDTIFFQLSNLRAKGSFRFVFTPEKINESGLQTWLEDNYLHTKTPLHVNDTTQINFVTDGTAESLMANRFRVVFDAPAGVLPLTVTNAKAYPKNNDIALEWEVENENGIKYYGVSKSADGIHFTSMTEMAARNNTNANEYNWLDGEPVNGYNYYRIKVVGVRGGINYSKVLMVFIGEAKTAITVFPNPVENGIIHLQFSNQPAGKYDVRILDQAGQVIVSKNFQYTNADNTVEQIPIGASIAHGVYKLEVVRPGGKTIGINLIY